MLLIVGLGNPGSEYEQTRHNIGFLAIDALIQSGGYAACNPQKKLHAAISQNAGVIIAKPTTFMNRSGSALSAITSYYDITETASMLIVHDDLDIQFGTMKLQRDRSAAGHNGVSSIAQSLNTKAFWRLRIGIDGDTKKDHPGESYVLQRFTTSERDQLTKLLTETAQAIQAFIQDGGDQTATRYNKKTPNKV